MQMKEAAALCASIKQSRVMPILATTAIKVENGKMEMVASNTETSVRITLDYPGAPFACCVDAKKLASALAVIQNPQFRFNERGLTILEGRTRILMASIPYQNHPGMIQNQDITGDVDSELIDMMRRAQYAAAVDDHRCYLNGIHIRSSGKRITVTASDGFRLATEVYELETAPFEVIVPGTAVAMIVKLNPDWFRIGRTVQCLKDNVEMVCNTIEGKYPDFERVFNHRCVDVKLSKEDLMRSIRALKISDINDNSMLNMEWTERIMKLTMINQGVNNSTEDEIDCDAPEPGQVNVSLSHFSDMIQSTDGDIVAIRYASENAPIYIINKNQRHLVSHRR